MNIDIIFKVQTEKKKQTKTKQNTIFKGKTKTPFHTKCWNSNNQKIFWQFVGFYALRILADKIYVPYGRIVPGAQCQQYPI